MPLFISVYHPSVRYNVFHRARSRDVPIGLVRDYGAGKPFSHLDMD